MSLEYMNTPEYQLNQADQLLKETEVFMNTNELAKAMATVSLAGKILDQVEYDLDQQ